MKQKTRQSFTLIEMLIVIVIIGILAAALIPRLQSIQGRARDTKRKTDLATIYNANEIFKLDNGNYAHSGIFVNSYLSTPSTWITGLLTIINSVPVDPINNGIPTLTGGYGYRYRFYGYLTSYHLSAQLESRQDASRCELKAFYYPHLANPTDGLPFCNSGSNLPLKQNYLYDPLNIRRH